jgi:uncharacterized protein (DUF2267 family)
VAKGTSQDSQRLARGLQKTEKECAMSLGSVDSIERTVQKTNSWIAEVASEVGIDDPNETWRILRAYLQVLRDRLTVEEAAQFAAQLPTLLRGAFYDGFEPKNQPEKFRHRDELFVRFGEVARPLSVDPAQALAATTRVLRRHVTEGEFEDVLAQLPTELRELLEQA